MKRIVIGGIPIKAFIESFGLQVIIMRLLLDVCFVQYVIPIFNASNYRYAFMYNFGIFPYLISWVVLLVSLSWSKKWYKSSNSSSKVLIFIYYIQFISFTTMMGFSCFDLLFICLNILYWLFLAFFGKYLLTTVIKDKNIEIYRYDQTFQFEVLITILSGLTSLYFAYVSGFRIDLNILNAYAYRDEARAYSTITGSTYLLGVARILIPTGVVYSIKKKKRWMLISFIIFSVLNYSFDGSKTLYFISIAAFFVGFFYKDEFLKKIPFLINIFLLAGYIEYKFNPLPFIYRLIIRRLYFVPNLINNTYYDYMLSHSPNLFSNLLRFIGYKGSYDISFVVGETYFHSPLMSANTGTIGDALWQFSFAGVVIMPLLIILLLKLLDKSTYSVPEEMTIIPCLVYAYYLNNSSFTAACFSHGLFMFTIIMLLYKSRYFTILQSEKRNENMRDTG